MLTILVHFYDRDVITIGDNTMHFAQRILSTTVLGLLLCTLAVFGAQSAQAAVSISAASWDGSTLTSNGSADKPKRGGGPVEIFDANTTV